MTYLTALPLLAAADVWEMIITAMFIILWVVGQLFGGRKPAKQKKPPRRPQPADLVEGELAGQGQRPPPRNQEEALRSEVEDFLRRAQGKPPRAEPSPQKPARQQPTRTNAPRTLVSKADPQATPTKADQSRKTLSSAGQPATNIAPNLRQEGVAEHVAKHLNTSEITAHSAALGADVGQSDERLEARLHEKFDHRLGSLQHVDTPTDSKAPEVDLASEIATMLSKPGGLQQMIIANEILRRPHW